MIRLIGALLMTLALAAPLRAAVDIQEVTSPGGIKAWLVQETSIPFTALEIRFRGGGSLDRPGKRGAINLMAATIEEGAGELDAQGFAAARDALAAHFGFGAQRDSISVSARFLTENRDEAVDLLRQALVAPRFDQGALDRVREQVLSGLRSDESDPNSIASRTFNEMAYGDHPYASSMDGTPESVAALTRDDIVTAYSDTIARDRVFVGAAGDISAEELGLFTRPVAGRLAGNRRSLARKGWTDLDRRGDACSVEFAPIGGDFRPFRHLSQRSGFFPRVPGQRDFRGQWTAIADWSRGAGRAWADLWYRDLSGGVRSCRHADWSGWNGQRKYGRSVASHARGMGQDRF